MSVLNKLACMQNRNDEIPNQELANELIRTRNRQDINEIAANLFNKDKKIQSDCIKTLYEIGYLNPKLIEEYVFDFLKLLRSKNNRLVWGGMIALSTIADCKASEIHNQLNEILNAMKNGSVITIDSAVLVLAKVAAQNIMYNKQIFPFLIDHLKNCRSKEVPQHAESSMIAVNKDNKAEFFAVLKDRESLFTPPQLTRIKKIYKILDQL